MYIAYILYISNVHSSSKRGEEMEIYISSASDQPIYAQITGQIRAKILSGELKEGEMLPSIRLLAKELRSSVITTKRAYEDLEAAGLIWTQPGRGSFVAAANRALFREEALKRVEEHLQQAIVEARSVGIEPEQLKEMLALLLEGE